jgi:hypothetical protein
MGGGQRHASAALPPGKTRYSLYRKLSGPHGWSGRVRKISPTPGFDPRIVQPVASRYTDWNISAPANQLTRYKMKYDPLTRTEDLTHLLWTTAVR